MRAESPVAPPKIKMAAPPSLAIFVGTTLGAVAVGAVAVVFFFNPAKNDFYPICVFHEMTGLNCPGCGGTRALYALLHGRWRLALKDNALFVFSLASLTVWSARFAFLKLRGRSATFQFSPQILWAFLAVAIVFAVLRNLPAFSFLSP
jgi:Protein of unknown function (DUF2752)